MKMKCHTYKMGSNIPAYTYYVQAKKIKTFSIDRKDRIDHYCYNPIFNI